MFYQMARTALTLPLLVFSLSLHALEFANVSDAVSNGKTAFTLRYRYEAVEQSGFDEDAAASTLLSRFSWTSAAVDQFSFGIEADYVSAIGSDDYNSTENGNTDFPVVADPEGFDLNQAYLRYEAKSATLTGGRQRILHTDQRFVGGVAWRQNEQTYDALTADVTPLTGLTLKYSYIWNVNRIFGPDDGAQPGDWRGDSNVLLLEYALNQAHSLRAFSYLLDFENDNGPVNSTATYGIGYEGLFGPLTVAAMAATQSDYADSPLSYSAPYYSFTAAVDVGVATLSAGYEVLGSDDGVAAFRTPLATLHKFQGWADIFLITPDGGIEDGYAGLAANVGPVVLALTYHQFSADEGGADYGDEIDLAATYNMHEKVSLQLKYADYSASEFAADTRKLWLSLNFTL